MKEALTEKIEAIRGKNTIELVKSYPELESEICAILMAEKFVAEHFEDNNIKNLFVEGVKESLIKNLLEGKENPPIKVTESSFQTYQAIQKSRK